MAPITSVGHQENAYYKYLSIYKLFFLFLVASLFGTYWEQACNFVNQSIFHRKLMWEYLFVTQQGVIFGPFNPVYGFGAVIFVILLGKRKRKWYFNLILGALIGGAFEYILSFLEELITKTKSWDYSGQFLNINGRTTIPIMLGWGIACVILINVIYPLLARLIDKIKPKIGKPILIVSMICLSLDMLFTGIVLVRQSLRHNDIAPATFVGRWIDEVYDDERLAKIFPDKKKEDEMIDAQNDEGSKDDDIS